MIELSQSINESFEKKQSEVPKKEFKWFKTLLACFISLTILFLTFYTFTRFSNDRKELDSVNSQKPSQTQAGTFHSTQFNTRREPIKYDYVPNTYENVFGDEPKFFKGIPENERAAVWGKYFMNLYRDRDSSFDIKDVEEIQIRDWKYIISKEINRTLGNNPKFKDLSQIDKMPQKLNNLLIEYGESDPGVKYMSGMNFPAAFLLTYYEFDDALFFFNVIMKLMGLRNIYMGDPVSNPYMKRLFASHNNMFEDLMPELFKLVKDNGKDDYLYNVYLSIFIGSNNYELSARIWDLFPAYDFNFEKSFPLFTVALIKANENIIESSEYSILPKLLELTKPEKFIEALFAIEKELNLKHSKPLFFKVQNFFKSLKNQGNK